ncbi:MAG TPA: hypothetical protein VEQ42_02410 [Pyrinomonadaceae bacterium]|nr:hypothetical protein [Pyrinomonadaceae bacterium]
MKKSRALSLLRLAAACAHAPAQSTNANAPASEPVTRVFKDGVLVSKELPAVRVGVDKAFKYLGGQSFILYGVARAEQHFFVDADKDGRVRRLYWLQFEGYLPNNTHSYNYKSDTKVNLGGLEFMADSHPANLAAMPPRPDSDGARARAFLAAKGFRTASDDILLQRLIHLADATRRSELLVIYVEDLAGTGLTAADLSPGGSAAARWPERSKALLERATKGLTITR